MATAEQELDILIRARYPIIYVVSWEEDRVERAVSQVAARQQKELAVWRGTTGFGPPNSPAEPDRHTPLQALDQIINAPGAAIYILKDLDLFLEDPVVVRRLRDAASALKTSYKTIIIVSPVLTIPPHLEKELTVVDFDLPDLEELAGLLQSVIAQVANNPNVVVDLNDPAREQIIKAAQGLTAAEAQAVFAKALVLDGRLDQMDVEVILSEKQQIIRKSGILEYYAAEEQFGNVGGLESLKEWLQKRSKAFSERARRFGLPEPKGILLIGVQGCGKSLCAKAVSALWHLPLLRLDVGSVFAGYVGSSEANMRKATLMAESVAPCILWLDELEKGFAGTQSSGQSDAGTSARVFGNFITWLQEKTAPVFVIATANNVSQLPPELMRKGRFDEIFFVDLPSEAERRQIFEIHIAKRGRDPSQFDLDALARTAAGFSGAEIEQAIVSALYDAFDAETDLTTEQIQQATGETVPLSQTMAERVSELRAWASTRARPASVPEEAPVGPELPSL